MESVFPLTNTKPSIFEFVSPRTDSLLKILMQLSWGAKHTKPECHTQSPSATLRDGDFVVVAMPNVMRPKTLGAPPIGSWRVA
jgi:hypothetical protein